MAERRTDKNGTEGSRIILYLFAVLTRPLGYSMDTRGGRIAKTILMTGRKKPPNCHCPYILVSNLVSSNVRFLFMCPLSTLFLPFSATHLGGRCYHVRHPFRLRRTCRAGRWPSVFGTRGIKVRQRSASLSSYSPALLPLGSVGERAWNRNSVKNCTKSMGSAQKWGIKTWLF